MTPSGAEYRRARIDLPAGMPAIVTARHVARTALTGWGFTDPEWLDEAEVIVSELVSNVVKHVGGSATLELEADLERVTVAVVDAGSRLPAPRSPHGSGGRGLWIVEALAAESGSRRRAGGKDVWARLRPHRPETADRRRGEGTDGAGLRPLVDLVTGETVANGGGAGVLTVTIDPGVTDLGGLLGDVAAARAGGRAVDLRVGLDPTALAMMPLLRPDVITVEVPELRTCPPLVAARIAGAVRAQAEHTGAPVAAAGIASAADRDMARALGAHVGHGPLFDPSRSAPAAGPWPAHRHNGAHGGTPFELVAAHRPVARAAKTLLVPMSVHIEHAGLDRDEPIVVMGSFQHAGHFAGETRRRYADLAGSAAFVAAVGSGMPAEPAPGVYGGRFAADDPLGREWTVVALGPRTATALVARDCGDTGPDRDRRFDYAVTEDRALVVRAAEALLSPWTATRAGTRAG